VANRLQDARTAAKKKRKSVDRKKGSRTENPARAKKESRQEKGVARPGGKEPVVAKKKPPPLSKPGKRQQNQSFGVQNTTWSEGDWGV